MYYKGLPIQYHGTGLILHVTFPGVGVDTLTMLTIDTNHPCKAISTPKQDQKETNRISNADG